MGTGTDLPGGKESWVRGNLGVRGLKVPSPVLQAVVLTALLTSMLMFSGYYVYIRIYDPRGYTMCQNEQWMRRRGDCVKHGKCVFVVSVGRSGSTALQDALNQMPNVYIRGENQNMLQFLYNLEQIALQNSRKYPKKDDHVGAAFEKAEYEAFVLRGNKPAWYSMFQANAAECAKSSYFRELYGYGNFRSYIVGFKEIRHAANLPSMLKLESERPWTFPKYRNGSIYETYERYLDWMRGLCMDSKIIFNMRREYNYSKGQGFYIGKGDTLKRNIEWMRRYQRAHRDKTHVVYYEDMFDKSKNSTIVEQLASFIGVKNDAVLKRVTFARVPKS